MIDQFSDKEPLPLVVNGREYPLLSHFVHRKADWIGGVLEDFGDPIDRRLFGGKPIREEITDIDLKPNGKDSAFFEVRGKRFCCGFDVEFGGITGGDKDWITFSGYGGHTWRIKRPDKAAPKPETPPELPLA